ncbi:MAG: ferritin family protein [SAR324 cluster bacterium]|nr:ferritin family protein [SAR324 cluster bacterium]
MNDTIFNAKEIFEIAIQIEKNGEQFYARAAEIAADPQLKKALQRLRAMESEHGGIFRKLDKTLEKELMGSFHFDPEGQQGLYLKAIANSHVFSTDIDVHEILNEHNSPQEILDMAIRFEKDSIMYFLGMKEIVPEELGKGQIEQLIQEEQGHVLYIMEEIAPLI